MKLENNWRHKSLENLEKDSWPNLGDVTELVKRAHELRQIPLSDFSAGDLRLMIGQKIGLPYLIPLSIEVLSKDLFAEADFFPGDLLKNVLAVDTDFWNDNKEYWKKLNDLIKDKRTEIAVHKFDASNFDNSIH